MMLLNPYRFATSAGGSGEAGDSVIDYAESLATGTGNTFEATTTLASVLDYAESLATKTGSTF